MRASSRPFVSRVAEAISISDEKEKAEVERPVGLESGFRAWDSNLVGLSISQTIPCSPYINLGSVGVQCTSMRGGFHYKIRVLEMGEPGNDCGGTESRMRRPFAERGQRSQATNNQVS